jgi:hypothetical protein
MKDLEKPLLRHDQIVALEDEKQRLEGMLADPYIRSKMKVGEARRTLAGIQKSFEVQRPEKLSPDEQDKLSKMEVELRTKITENMPTEETMRKNPPGAVDHHRKWEAANKRLIMRWKNIRRQLDPESDDKDIANLERYRPSGQANALRTDAQISGHMSYGSISDKNWKDAFGQTEPKREKREWSEEQKQAARDRMAVARAKKAASKSQNAEVTATSGLGE